MEGFPGKFNDARFQEALRRVAEAARRHGKLAAMQPAGLQQAEQWLAMGFHFMSWTTDIALFRAALQKEIQELRALTAAARSAPAGRSNPASHGGQD